MNVISIAELEKSIYKVGKWDRIEGYEPEVALSREPAFIGTIIDTLDISAGNNNE